MKQSIFDVVTSSQIVAMNQVSIYAADSAANMYAELYLNGGCTEGTYLKALTILANENRGLGKEVKFIISNLVNFARLATQSLGDAKKPLKRITGEVGKQFNLLTGEEIEKDFAQVQEGARILLKAWEDVQKPHGIEAMADVK